MRVLIAYKEGGLTQKKQTPEKKVIALARVADLARDIGSKCYYGFDSINGEVTDAGGLVIVVSGADC